MIVLVDGDEVVLRVLHLGIEVADADPTMTAGCIRRGAHEPGRRKISPSFTNTPASSAACTVRTVRNEPGRISTETGEKSEGMAIYLTHRSGAIEEGL